MDQIIIVCLIDYEYAYEWNSVFVGVNPIIEYL